MKRSDDPFRWLPTKFSRAINHYIFGLQAEVKELPPTERSAKMTQLIVEKQQSILDRMEAAIDRSLPKNVDISQPPDWKDGIRGLLQEREQSRPVESVAIDEGASFPIDRPDDVKPKAKSEIELNLRERTAAAPASVPNEAKRGDEVKDEVDTETTVVKGAIPKQSSTSTLTPNLEAEPTDQSKDTDKPRPETASLEDSHSDSKPAETDRKKGSKEYYEARDKRVAEMIEKEQEKGDTDVSL